MDVSVSQFIQWFFKCVAHIQHTHSIAIAHSLFTAFTTQHIACVPTQTTSVTSFKADNINILFF